LLLRSLLLCWVVFLVKHVSFGLLGLTRVMSITDKMASKTELSLHLEKKQLEWLQAMAKKYNLPSAGGLFFFAVLTSVTSH
jgi:hypothetical protein